MSVYYSLFCETCMAAVAFVSRGSSDGFTWMVGANVQVPAFLASHAGHLGAIRILDEDTADFRVHDAAVREIHERRRA
jgi:hypothetical protein